MPSPWLCRTSFPQLVLCSPDDSSQVVGVSPLIFSLALSCSGIHLPFPSPCGWGAASSWKQGSYLLCPERHVPPDVHWTDEMAKNKTKQNITQSPYNCGPAKMCGMVLTWRTWAGCWVWKGLRLKLLTQDLGSNSQGWAVGAEVEEVINCGGRCVH